jgi:uncharacterized protein YndB with AHSA1/START domain
MPAMTQPTPQQRAPQPAPGQQVHAFELTKDELIDAPIEFVFQSVLDEVGPEMTMPDGTCLALKIEPWPGGRWFRDLGNNAGHFWGHVQVIKPPNLLELNGPMFMSFPAANHVQYRLTPEGNGTRLKFTHRAMGLLPNELRDGMDEGWSHIQRRIAERAKRRRDQR